MKIFKRFFPLQGWLCAIFTTLALFALSSCENMTSIPLATMRPTASKTLYAPSFPEKTANSGESLSYCERYYTVSQGLKRKISLSWNPVGIAKYYEVWAARNINDNFEKVGETSKMQFDDIVSPGKTYYYKVRAVNSKGEFSEFSDIVHGTSLATPSISYIEVNDTNATVFWYMGNVGVDSYAKDLVYEVHAKGDIEKVKTIKAWNEDTGSIVEECKFESLSGNCEYTFQVFAYITSEQDKVEKSPEVSQRTLALYTPVSPEFTASQGESINGIKLFITLPPKVQVQVVGKDNPEDYPICFEVQRKRSGETSWQTVVPVLYFNGTTSKPVGSGAYDTYQEGSLIEWLDVVGSSAASIARGAKYDYRIISCTDENYTTVKGITAEDVILPAPSKESLANTAQGWAVARPEFKVSNLKRNINAIDSDKVDSVSLGFEASWNDMGKAADYKFAIEYERSYNDGVNDKVETKWLIDSNLNIIFSSLEEVSSIEKVYDLKNNESGVKGRYKYTLYLFPAKYTSTSQIKGNELDRVQADNIIGVDSSAIDPLKDLKAEGGWTDHILLTWTVEDGVEYRIDWEKFDDLETKVDEGVITSDKLKNEQGKYTGRYEHKVDGGFLYKYIISANSNPGNTDGSIPQARTLGKPIIVFSANSYTDITISWKQVVAAEKYQVKLGTNGGFGNGASFVVSADGVVSENTSGLTIKPGFLPDATYPERIYDDPTKTLKLVISKPYGYKDATLSGKSVALVVTALSEVDSQNHIKGSSPATKDVWTIGPATLNLKGTESFDVKPNEIKITWQKAQGEIVGYAVYRMRPKMAGDTESDGLTVKYKDPAFDCYYVNAAGTSVSKSGASVDFADGTYTFVDTYEKADSASDAYQMNQQYLALGIPFTYTVIPVIKSADAKDVEKEEDIKPTGETYINFSAVQKLGYTTGYGIALEASKAEYDDKVVLNWELPQSAIDKQLYPTIYYRNKASGPSVLWTKWKTLTKSDAREATINTGIDRVQALEYAVTYSDSMDSSIVGGKDIAFVEYQRELKNKSQTPKLKPGLDLEPKCVGYMFTMPKIEPEKQDESTESFTETVQWYFYDKEGNRAIGGSDITEYTLELRNLNCSEKYYKIYTYNASGVKQTEGSQSWYDTEFNTNTSGQQVTVTVTPKFEDGDFTNSTYHDGLLKVMRDYKHYYRISAKRTNAQNDQITATSEDYAYRQIKPEERRKCVGLICADALFQLGMPSMEGLLMWKWSDPYTLDGKTGSIFIQHQSTSNKARWGTHSGLYQHKFPRTPGNPNEEDDKKAYLTSGFYIAIDDTEGGKLGGSSGSGKTHNLQSLPSTTITITHECPLPSYAGSLSITDGNGGGSEWFPYNFGTQYTEGKSTKDDSFLCYKSFWWEVQP